MSSIKVDENSTHRKSKVSWALIISPGLGGPKEKLKGVSNGQAVNILLLILVSEGVTFYQT